MFNYIICKQKKNELNIKKTYIGNLTYFKDDYNHAPHEFHFSGSNFMTYYKTTYSFRYVWYLLFCNIYKIKDRDIEYLLNEMIREYFRIKKVW